MDLIYKFGNNSGMELVIDIDIARKRLAENVDHCMRETHLSLAEVAEAVDCTIPTIHRLRKGENDPSFTLVARVADFFGLTLDELLLSQKEFRKVSSERLSARRKKDPPNESA